jgi:hypothetical protein
MSLEDPSISSGQGVARLERQRPEAGFMTLVRQNEAADSAPVLGPGVAAPFPDPLLHVCDHQIELATTERG